MNTTPVFASTVFDRATVEAQRLVMENARKAQEAAQRAVRNAEENLITNPYEPFEIAQKDIGAKLNITDTNIAQSAAEEDFKIFIIG